MRQDQCTSPDAAAPMTLQLIHTCSRPIAHPARPAPDKGFAPSSAASATRKSPRRTVRCQRMRPIACRLSEQWMPAMLQGMSPFRPAQTRHACLSAPVVLPECFPDCFPDFWPPLVDSLLPRRHHLRAGQRVGELIPSPDGVRRADRSCSHRPRRVPAAHRAGVHRLANPGLDAVRQATDDILAPQRQAERARITESLARFQPTRIAVETSPKDDAKLVEAFQAWKHQERGLRTSEVEQLGFRLAAQQGLPAVQGIDWMGMPPWRPQGP